MKADKYCFDHEALARVAEEHGRLLEIERNKLNPLCGRTFVSIAYYEMKAKFAGERDYIIGVVF